LRWSRIGAAGPIQPCPFDRLDDVTGGKILLPEDNARTWPHSAAFPDARKITFSHILTNGNIFFATGAKLYLSTDNLTSHKPSYS